MSQDNRSMPGSLPARCHRRRRHRPPALDRAASHGRAHARSMLPLPVELERQFFRGKDLPLLSFFLSIHSASAVPACLPTTPPRHLMGPPRTTAPSSCHSFLSSSPRCSGMSWPLPLFLCFPLFLRVVADKSFISSVAAVHVFSHLGFSLSLSLLSFPLFLWV